MSRYVFKLPDLGEGTVSAEIVAWHVKPGDTVTEDAPLAEMSTDKAVVEVPSPVGGRVITLGGEPGDVVAVGAVLVVIETDATQQAASVAMDPVVPSPPSAPAAGKAFAAASAVPTTPGQVMAAPATRARARAAGVDLAAIQGTGPAGRVRAIDLENVLPHPDATVDEIKVIGVRRLIAQRMSEAKRTIPHFAYIEEVDVTELERLRGQINGKLTAGEPPLTYLPFIVSLLVPVLRQFPQCNAHYDEARNTILRYHDVHVGIATQTPDGLKVPVVRNAGQLSLHELAAAIRRVAEAARTNRARREELTGSTITVTSLGKLGGIASTPIINAPEVAIIGINKAVERPVVRDGKIVIRRVMNLSSSFDHRFVDGFDAAAMVQALKERLENPDTQLIGALQT